MTNDFGRKQFMARLENGQKAYDEAMVKFQGRLQVDPVEAFRWVETQASLAARAQVFNRYLKFLKGVEANLTSSNPEGEVLTFEQAFERIRADLTDTVIRSARNVTYSTSNMMNYIDSQTLAAHAELLDELKFVGF